MANWVTKEFKDCKKEVDELVAQYLEQREGHEDFLNARANLTERMLERISHGIGYAPAWAKELLKLYKVEE